jgi:hypothetical protein
MRRFIPISGTTAIAITIGVLQWSIPTPQARLIGDLPSRFFQ